MKRRNMVALFFNLFLILGLTSIGMAETFPSRTIRFIIPFPPGGGNDIVGRAIQRPLEKELGTKIIMENIPGGATKVATLEVLKAKPDGYTIMILPDHAWLGLYYSKTYDTKMWEKITPIASMTSEPWGFIETRTESPYKTWADFVKAAKANPGKLSCGSPYSGGVMELIFAQMTKASGIEVTYVPFAGAGPAQVAMLGGHVDVRICMAPEAINMIKAGKSRGLVTAGEKRLKAIPDVPTFKELNLGESLYLTRSIWGPPNLPHNILNVISRGIEKAIQDPDFVKLIENDLMYTIAYSSGPKVLDDLRKFDSKYGPSLAASYK
jgi:tripartite-type tricarboxylate transporter receptor subunit TctC